MRISTDEGDKGYSPLSHKFKVMFDGELLDDCFTADEELREAWCYHKNEHGWMVKEDEPRKGDVVIIRPGR